jgi:hypothetical protein
MQGFIIVEAFAELALKAFSKPVEGAGLASLKARVPPRVGTGVIPEGTLTAD